MDKIKKHAIWVILIAIIVGVMLMLKSRKVAADESVAPVSTSSCAKYTDGMLEPNSLTAITAEQRRAVTVRKQALHQIV